MRDRLYLAGFIILAGVLLWIGREEIRGSLVLSWGLSFGGAGAVAVLLLLLYRFRIELAASRHELARKEAELSFAMRVQQELFPKRLPSGNGLEYDAVCVPARGISGDYYDVLSLPGGREMFAIADISGKGISAAILMANLQASLRVLATSGANLEEIVSRLNGHLFEVTDAARFATFFGADWQASDARLRYVNAGHHPPFVFGSSQNGDFEKGGIPLGILPAYPYTTGEIALKPGDLLVFFSDGITEAGIRGEKEYGEDRLRRLIEQNLDLPLAEIRARVMRSVREWTGEEVEDDMTLLLVRRVAP